MSTNGLIFTSGENKGKLIDAMDMQTLHYMKLGIDNELSIANKPLNSSLGDVELGKVQNTKQKLLTILDSNKEYQQARNLFAGSMATQEAMDFGLNIFTNKAYKQNPEKVIGLYNDAEKEAFRNGVFEAVLRKMETSTDNSNVGLKIIGNERNRNLLRLAFPEDVDESTFNEFINNFQQEIDARAVEVRVLAGSQTAQRNKLAEVFDDKSSRAMNTRGLTADELVNSKDTSI
jgi:NhaP-type Na+/H+ and K+/H+ antiporter